MIETINTIMTTICITILTIGCLLLFFAFVKVIIDDFKDK